MNKIRDVLGLTQDEAAPDEGLAREQPSSGGSTVQEGDSNNKRRSWQ